MATQDTLRRLRDAANRQRAEISKASGIVATQRTRAAAATATAEKTKSATTAKTKHREAERATKAANDAEGKRAAAEKKLADIEREIAKTQVKYEKDRDTAQAKAYAELSRKADQASARFRPTWDAAVSARHELPGSEEPACDVFLSHASEDKDAIARPLQIALEKRGVSVWFDEIKIRVGQSIRQAIESGIAQCRFGVVIISPHFFAKRWTQAELDGLFGRKMNSGENMILPVWHHISKDEVIKHSPLLSGIAALNSATMTIDEIADNLAEAVRM